MSAASPKVYWLTYGPPIFDIEYIVAVPELMIDDRLTSKGMKVFEDGVVSKMDELAVNMMLEPFNKSLSNEGVVCETVHLHRAN